jgi:hypothetical protein
MRWPFRRPAPSFDAPEPVAGDTPVRAARVGAEAWRELEPLRTIAPIELAADGRRFSEGLGVRHPVELALRPLGHNLSLDAPQGIVSNIARAAVASDRELDLPLVPTRRAEAPAAAVVTRRQAPLPVASAPVTKPVTPSPAVVAPPLDLSAPARSPGHEPPETAEPEPAYATRPAPPRQLEAVERPTVSLAERRSELPLVPRALPVAQAVAPGPVTSAAPRQNEAPFRQDEAPSADVVEVAPAAELPTVGTRLEPTIEIAAPAAADPTPPAMRDAPDLPVPLVRRLGLGAPIVPGAPAEVVRPLAASVPPAQGEPPPIASRPTVAPRDSEPERAPEPGGPVVRATPGGRAAPAVARSSEPEQVAATPGTRSIPEAIVDAPAETAAALPPAPVAPLVGATEIRQTETALPIAERPERTTGDPGHGAGDMPVVPTARPRSPSAAPSGSTTRPLTGATRIASAPAPAARAVQRAEASTPALRTAAPQTSTQSSSAPSLRSVPTSARPALAPAAPAPGSPPVGVGAHARERIAEAPVAAPRTGTGPVPDVPLARRLTAVPDPVETSMPLARPIASPALPREASTTAPALSLPLRAPLRPATAPASQSTPSSPLRMSPAPRPVQRAVEINELQITPAQAPAGAAAPASAPASTSTPTSTAAAPAGAAAAQDPEHLREQVLRWVRAELLVNRERAGRLTDLR